jgi:hypothetical protein
MEARAALVVERLGHERRKQVPLAGDLLHGRLQPERAVGRVGHLGVPEIDLELPRRELMVGRGDPQSDVAQQPQHPQQYPLRVALAADDVDVAQVVGVPTPCPFGVLLAQVELKLGTADQRSVATKLAGLGYARAHLTRSASSSPQAAPASMPARRGRGRGT